MTVSAPAPTAIDSRYLPVSGLDMPRFAGIASFMRLPIHAPARPGAAEVALFGVPADGGTTNRPGTRHGPRAVRDASTMIRAANQATGIAPFHSVRCADFGDIPVNPANLKDTLKRITRFVERLRKAGVTPLAVGGDHLISLPILRALGCERPLGMIHFDAHTDLYRGYFGGRDPTHGTPFRMAVEEGLLDARRVVQIGIRGTGYDGHDVEFARAHGVRIVFIEELMARGIAAVMDEARDIVGSGPVYVSFDIDGIDPSQAPGTGTPEIGGFSTFQAQQMVRRLEGLEIVAADLVEISPPFDVGGMTAYAGASILFELLCVMSVAEARRRARDVQRVAAYARR